jgi:hypothetical protein
MNAVSGDGDIASNMDLKMAFVNLAGDIGNGVQYDQSKNYPVIVQHCNATGVITP